MHILLVEDHPVLREMMTAHLRERGFVTDAVGRGDEAIAAAARDRYDAVVLDLGLPDLDGLAVLRSLRDGPGNDVAVLVLTARSSISDRVDGLDAGADDYLLKPFDLDEFDARLRSILRRAGRWRDPVLRLGALAFDTGAREARINGVPIELTRRELLLLEELMRSAGRTVVRNRLEEGLYGTGESVSGNALEAVVSRLRRGLARAGEARSGDGSEFVIETVRGIGYRLVLRSPRPV